MSFVLGISGTLVMIVSAAAAFVASVTKSFDESAGQEVDQVFFGKLKRRIRIGFWGGLTATIVAAILT